jgi:hypothetical protein
MRGLKVSGERASVWSAVSSAPLSTRDQSVTPQLNKGMFGLAEEKRR